MFDPWLDLTTENREDAVGEETIEAPPGNRFYQLPPQPERIGRYRVERPLGQGGFGLVYLAYDEQLCRRVAVKVPHGRLVSSPADAELYLAEARTVAGLDHPSIVPVYDVGSTDQFPCYVVSKFIDGSTLAAKLRHERLPMVQAVELVATVAEALHHAHEQGFVHRDVKPGNILIDLSGKPFVVDFGLALREQELGKGSRYAGTPKYMSPEQARGEGHRVDARSDIFSLGVVFYELLVGEVPFTGQTREALMEQITSQEPRSPRQRDDQVARELDRICLKALAKRASDRYSTGREMADDLRFFLATPDQTPSSYPSRAEPQPQASAASSALDHSQSATIPVRVVPKGLRSFDEHDADFFLELLPGPRDRNGLPDSLRFWKSWIEETDPARTAPVGLIYGPSGCGKSSMVKAGLLPRLSDRIVAVYVEATPHETETRLLRGVRRHCPELADALSLRESLAALRRGQGLPQGKKVLLILDQFEQWLHARPDDENMVLVEALRQCDGERLQCIAMVRDDFWMGATRFMKALEIRILEGQNSSAVDLFDPSHARKVLASFGRAFGKFPDRSAGRSRELDDFLKDAVSGLAQDGKIVCVRLALFAEMMKGKPWNRSTLSEVGGTRGVGLTFLEENLSASTAPPEHRYHQQAARAVLQALIPQSGTDIKGHMRSYSDLLEASGYSARRDDFEDLIRVLDFELRLISPTDPEGITESAEASSRGDSGHRYYQLTHDYLVHSLRDWLTRKQRETRRGRAELRLAERSELWATRPENRFLPPAWEWADIRLLTNKKTWSESQRAMMARAGRMHGMIGLATLILIALAVWSAIEMQHELTASGLVGSLKTANTSEVPSIIKQLDGLRRWADPQLLRLLKESLPSSSEHLHASLALLADDPSQAVELTGRLLAASTTELPVLRQALLPHQVRVAPRLWTVVSAAKPGEPFLLSAASALALYAPDDPRWNELAPRIAERLVRADPMSLRFWLESFRPARSRLQAPLAAILRDRDPMRAESHRELAAVLLANYLGDQPLSLADLLMDCDPIPFATLLPVALGQPAEVLPSLLSELDKKPETGGDPAKVEAATDRLTARQARAAVVLFHMDRFDVVQPMLATTADPRLRGFLINWLPLMGADPNRLAAELVRLDSTEQVGANSTRPFDQAILFHPATSTRRALVLALGNYDKKELPPELRESLVQAFLKLYHDDPDCGIHSAAEWALVRWKEEARLRKVDAELMKNGDRSGRRWSMNTEGQTFAIVEGRIEFRMGSPPSEPHRLANEVLHRRIIPRRFAICTKEVSTAQFERFLKENPEFEPADCREFSPAPEGPASKPSWYIAAAYCNWLSRREHLSECYERNPSGQFDERMTIPADVLTRTGYRLPTEAEWEFSCRAGSLTSRYYGTSRELLGRYVWFNLNADGLAWPCGSLLPNDLGLFDMLGNVYEWCQDPKSDYQPDPDGVIVDQVTSSIPLVQTTDHILRGGGFVDVPAQLRSAQRFWNLPHNRLGSYGFRIARTLP